MNASGAPVVGEDRPPRVLLSYAHEGPEHEELVLRFYEFLRSVGVDARIDRLAAEEPQVWTRWMRNELRRADFVAVIASPEYRARADGTVPPDEGRGVQYEARLIEEEFYANHVDARSRMLPVVLPGRSADEIPTFLGPTTGTHYEVTELTKEGAEQLLRYVFDQPYLVEPPLGPQPQFGRRRPTGGEVAEPAARLLPPVGTVFGRTAEVAAVVAGVRAGGPVLVIGPAGIGKSTICRAALHECAADTDHALFVRCDGLETADAIVGAIGRELGIAPSADMTRLVLATLAGTSSVVVLDNAETPWQAAQVATEELFERVAAIDVVRLVVAMRVGTRPPRPRWATVLEVEPLKRDPAVEMFRSISGTDEDDAAITPLVEAVDRVPLAVELLATAAVTERSLGDVAERWERERAVLLQRTPGIVHKQANMVASVELSWDGAFMTDQSRRICSLLAESPSGLTAEELADLVGPDHLDGIARLRQQSLVYDDGQRVRMLAPLRESVAAQHPPGEADLQALLSHWASIAAAANRIGWEGGAVAAAELAGQLANLERGVVGLLDNDRLADAVEAAVAISRYYMFAGSEPGPSLDRTIELAGDRPEDLARALHTAGQLAFGRSRNDQARGYFERALPLFREVGDRQGEANCYAVLGEVDFIESRADKGRGYFERALPLYREMDDELGEANCYVSLGRVDFMEGRRDDGREYLERALPLYRNVSDKLGEANCYRNLGEADLAESRHDEAEQHFELALPLYLEIGDKLGEANCYRGLGQVSFAGSRGGEARRYFERALPLYREIGDLYSEGLLHVTWARWSSGDERREHVQAARACWGQAAPHFLTDLDEIFGDDA